MAMIYVKTKPGRRAYYNGRAIPDDKFMPVNDTPYVRRLITHWQDVELEEGSEISKRGAEKPGTKPLRSTEPRPTETIDE